MDNNNNECLFTKSIISKLDTVKLPNDNNDRLEDIESQIKALKDTIFYLGDEIQKIYKYLKSEQDKKYKITSNNSIKSVRNLPD